MGTMGAQRRHLTCPGMMVAKHLLGRMSSKLNLSAEVD